jgi:hypothetical protein
MVVRTYFDKNNTIVANDYVNTARNPVTELFYGGTSGDTQYSRFLFHFDETRLRSLYTGGTYPDLTKLTHTLKLTNTAIFDEELLNTNMGGKDRASSFDLIVFKLTQPFDEGVGYDYSDCRTLWGNCSISEEPSNWFSAQTGTAWTGGAGTYTGSPSAITIATQHFDLGNENLEVDITNYVNGLLTGDTNYGLGIAYMPFYESLPTTNLQYVGFFTRHTQTFYEPFIDTVYDNNIVDDRKNFYLDKPNKLYLYVNLAGRPTNLDTRPGVNIYDNEDVLISAYTPSQVTHVTKGVYSIDILIPTLSNVTDEYLYTDTWTGITINGVSRPNISLNFELRDSLEYYNIGDEDMLPRKVAVSIAGINSQEKIKRGDIRKVIVSSRIPYTVEQEQKLDSIKYRLYVTEGKNEYTVIDYQPVQIASNYNYFLLDTLSLIPSTYHLDILVESNLEVTTLKNVVNFDIVSESNHRLSQ